MIDPVYDTLLIEHPCPHVLQITLNRPDAANAFNTQMAKDLVAVFEAVALDPRLMDSHGNALPEVRCIILTGSGVRAFCAGGDLKERNGMSDEDWGRQHLIFERMTRALIDCPVPKIAAVNGAAYGGGCEIAAAADFAYAAEMARFALTEVTLGIIPGAGGTQTLARAMGLRRAKEIILTGEPFTAQEARDWGLVNNIFPIEDLQSAAQATAVRIARNAPIAVRQARQAIERGAAMALADGLAFEIEAYNRTVPTQDRQEGVRAYNEKRKPEFKGS